MSILTTAHRAKTALHLHSAVALQNIADLDVVVAVDLHAALVAGTNFLGVVLEALELLQTSILLDGVSPDITVNKP